MVYLEKNLDKKYILKTNNRNIVFTDNLQGIYFLL